MTLVNVENYFQKEGETDQVTNETVYTGQESHEAVIPIGTINDKYLNHVKLYFEWTNIEANNEEKVFLYSNGRFGFDRLCRQPVGHRLF